MGARVSIPFVQQGAARRRVPAKHHLINRTGADGVVPVADDVVGPHATRSTTRYTGGRVAGVWDLAEEPNTAIGILLFEPNQQDREHILDRAPLPRRSAAQVFT